MSIVGVLTDSMVKEGENATCAPQTHRSTIKVDKRNLVSMLADMVGPEKQEARILIAH